MKAGLIRLAANGILAAIIGLSECDTVKAATVETPEKAKPESVLVLIKDGQSDYGIYYHASSPSCVKRAATEMQRVIRISTGVTLPILAEPRNPMICLGDNAVSREAGFSSERTPDEGFRIVTRDGNIYIVGQDWPDKRKKWADCESIGTLYGAYEFLERIDEAQHPAQVSG
ncbi:MAG: hypothetical protein WCP55_08655, partial [Lentisphaerota bacterium]